MHPDYQHIKRKEGEKGERGKREKKRKEKKRKDSKPHGQPIFYRGLSPHRLSLHPYFSPRCLSHFVPCSLGRSYSPPHSHFLSLTCPRTAFHSVWISFPHLMHSLRRCPLIYRPFPFLFRKRGHIRSTARRSGSSRSRVRSVSPTWHLAPTSGRVS